MQRDGCSGNESSKEFYWDKEEKDKRMRKLEEAINVKKKKKKQDEGRFVEEKDSIL